LTRTARTALIAGAMLVRAQLGSPTKGGCLSIAVLKDGIARAGSATGAFVAVAQTGSALILLGGRRFKSYQLHWQQFGCLPHHRQSCPAKCNGGGVMRMRDVGAFVAMGACMVTCFTDTSGSNPAHSPTAITLRSKEHVHAEVSLRHDEFQF
jgi:hypothetical protein